MRSRAGIVVPVTGLVLAIVLLLGYGLQRQEIAAGASTFASRSTLAGRPAPELKVSRFDGQPLRLADYRGKAVVLNFWASWCPPCRDEAPALERVAQRYQGSGVAVLGVALWDTASASQSFIEQVGMTYQTGQDETGETAIAYGVSGMPETFLIDQEGRIVRKWVGPITEEGLSTALDALVER